MEIMRKIDLRRNLLDDEIIKAIQVLITLLIGKFIGFLLLASLIISQYPRRDEFVQIKTIILIGSE